MATTSPESIAEIHRLCKLLSKRCDISKVKITVYIPHPRMYDLLPNGTYKHKYDGRIIG